MGDTGSSGFSSASVRPRSVLLVALAAFLVYFLLPGNPLVEDAGLTVFSEGVLEADVGKILQADFWGLPLQAEYATRSYRPLVSLTYAAQVHAQTINDWLGGLHRFLHLADMLLHALMSVMVVLLGIVLLPGSRWPLAAGYLFALHPICTEAVCSVVGRADILASLLLVIALTLHLSAGGSSRRRWILESLTVLCLGAALYCKEYAVAFPFILIAVDGARIAAGRMPRAMRRAAFGVWGGAFAFLGVYLGVRLWLVGELGGVPMLGPGDQPLLEEPLDVRWGTAAALLLTAVRLLAAPYELNYFYCAGTVPLAEGLFDLRALAGAGLAALLIAVAGWWAWRRREIAPAVFAALFLLPLGPSLNTVSVAGVMFAERFLYLPLAGTALLVAWAFERYLRSRRAVIAGVALVALISVVHAGLTIGRVTEWGSVKTLVRDALETYPRSACAQYRLGTLLLQDGKPQEAAEWFEGAIDVEPRKTAHWKDYADALMRLGRYDQAADAMRRVVQMAPMDVGVLWTGLGEAELRAGRPEAAVRALRRAADLAPQDRKTAQLLGQARLRLAQQRLEEGMSGEAKRLAVQAVEGEDLPAEGIYLAALVVDRAGDRGLAEDLFDRALDEDPDLLRKKHRMAVQLDQQGQHARAASLFREILIARPRHAHTLFNLGRSLVLAGQPAEAIPVLRAGLRLADDPGAERWLSRARREASSATGGSSASR